jgi:hypothetical protein
MKTKLAATLACLLPQSERDEYRRGRVSAETILRLFEFDHVRLHALGGTDKWFDLDPKLHAVHREKSRRDTAIVAKVKRLAAVRPYASAFAAAESLIAAMDSQVAASNPKRSKRRIAKRANGWPPRGSRPLRSRSSFTAQ